MCQRCDRPDPSTGSVDGTCRALGNEDPDLECGGEGQCAGLCNGSGGCSVPAPGKKCGLCRACDEGGRCRQPPADDEDCGAISCGGVAAECVIFTDLTANRCAGLGQCLAANDPLACTEMQTAPDGTRCTGGVCMSGRCVPSSGSADGGAGSPDGSPPPGGGGGDDGGCALGGSSSSASRLSVALMLLALATARRRARSRRRFS
jgi:hypothetical protein